MGWEGSSAAGTSCQERAAVVLLGNELQCLIPASFQPHPIPQSLHRTSQLGSGWGRGAPAPPGCPGVTAGNRARLALVSHQLLAASLALTPVCALRGTCWESVGMFWEQGMSCSSSWVGEPPLPTPGGAAAPGAPSSIRGAAVTPSPIPPHLQGQLPSAGLKTGLKPGVKPGVNLGLKSGVKPGVKSGVKPGV